MSTAKRPPRKAAVAAALPVPRVRAIRSDDSADAIAIDVGQPTQARPRRNRKPKFVF